MTDTRTPFVTYGLCVDQKFDYGEIGRVSQVASGRFLFGIRQTVLSLLLSLTLVVMCGYHHLILEIADRSENMDTEMKVRGSFGNKLVIQPWSFDRYVTLNTKQYG
jgi:hypothetical protein